MKIPDYDREAVLLYARKWAYRRNPAYLNFDGIGGDCTNFASQCIYAGCGIMNYTPVFGWYYITADMRTASWTGVEFLYNFLTDNDGAGPFARETDRTELEIGDIIQLGRETGDFYHTCVVCGFRAGIPLVASHTYDAFNKPLTAYRFEKVRFLHIEGVRSAAQRPCR